MHTHTWTHDVPQIVCFEFSHFACCYQHCTTQWLRVASSLQRAEAAPFCSMLFACVFCEENKNHTGGNHFRNSVLIWQFSECLIYIELSGFSCCSAFYTLTFLSMILVPVVLLPLVATTHLHTANKLPSSVQFLKHFNDSFSFKKRGDHLILSLSIHSSPIKKK